MKLQKLLMRIWLLLTSAALFAGTWIALAHSPKPVAAKTADVPAMPSLPPIPSIQDLSLGQQFDPGPSIVQRPMTRLRTRGS